MECPHCDKPCRALCGWAVDPFRAHSVWKGRWQCRRCAELRYTSEGGALVIRSRGFLGQFLRWEAGGECRENPRQWYPYVFSDPGDAKWGAVRKGMDCKSIALGAIVFPAHQDGTVLGRAWMPALPHVWSLGKKGGRMTAKDTHFDSEEIQKLMAEFAKYCEPLETGDKLLGFADAKTGAHYCECHLKGSAIVSQGTVDVPLDPDEQPEYRANRQIVLNDSAFQAMRGDAKEKRSFSNIVAEWTTEFDDEHPLKIIGGQHRFEAIREALDQGADVYHGVKVYLGLDTAQRLDVQLISNTNIDVSGDLIDRLQETAQGPELRNWCQAVGLLDDKHDFADSFVRSGPISVRMARTFITNYYKGATVDPLEVQSTDTTPEVCPSGARGTRRGVR
jgi:hypothetical protein